jgi:hypothetical protein
MLEPNDAVWVLDVCDRVLAERSQRGHRFAWLLSSADPDAEPARVDAWYPPLNVVVDLGGVRGADELHRRARIVRAYGLEYLVVSPGGLERDPQGRLRRLEHDEERIRAQIGTPAARREQWFEWGAPFGPLAGYAGGDLADEDSVEPDDAWDEEDEDVDDGEAPWPPADVTEPVDGIGPVDTASGEVLGWRGRAIAEALVGAIALGRRAFGVDVVGRGDQPEGREVLLALAVAEARAAVEAGLTRREIATTLAADPWGVGHALERLEVHGHVRRCAPDPGDDGPDAATWTLEPPGLAVVVEWLSHASPLFRDWPPDLPG